MAAMIIKLLFTNSVFFTLCGNNYDKGRRCKMICQVQLTTPCLHMNKLREMPEPWESNGAQVF